MSRTFPISDDKVGIPNHAAIQSLTAWTMAAWIFPVDGGPSAAHQAILSKVAGGNSGRYFLLFYDDNHASFHNALRIVMDRTVDGVATSVDDVAPFNQWLHVVATYDGTDGPRIFTRTNGLFAEVSYVARIVGGNVWNSDANAALVIGQQGTVADRNFPGRIAEVKLWNARMPLAEIQIIAGGMNPRPANLVGYWPLYGDYAPEPDLSSQGGHGVIFQDCPKADHAPVGEYASQAPAAPQNIEGSEVLVIPQRGWCR